MAAIKALQQWCKVQCDGYRDVSITNMTTSFRNGLAFCALIHKHRPDLINYDSLSKENVYDNNNLAFRVAEEQLGIPALLDAEDMVALKVPDRLSILTYVSQYYNFFHGRSPIGGMGGIKRPAEDPKEEPSVKKNLPVIAKPATENRPPVTVVAPTPSRPLHKPDHVTDQKNVLTEKSNKMGTLSSTCAVCKNHVHLVQRHLVDGKLYHRSCFKCHQCSNILLSGTYKAGQKPGTFVCTTHQGTQNSSKATTSRDFGKNGSGKAEAGSSLPAAKRDRSPNPRPVSVLSTPVNVSPQPNKQSPAGNRWTPSAERTQAARQKFFQATPEPPSSGKLSAAAPKGQDGSRVLLKVVDEKEKARSLISAKLTEGNSNNNNTSNQGGLRTAESRQGKGLATVEVPSWRKDKGSTAKPLEPLARLSTATNKDSPRSSCAFSPSKIDYERSETPSDWRSRLKPVSSGEGLKPANSLFTSEIKVAVKQSPRGSANVLSPQTPMVSITIPFTQPESTRAPSPKQPHRGSGDRGLKNRAASSSVPAPRPETESPPGKSPDDRQEEILKELKQIENSLNDLEKEGVELEKRLRQFEEEGKEELLDALMVDWFTLIRNKQNHMRRESELVYIAKTQELEQQQPGVEGELRRLMTKPEHLKTAADRHREEELMERLVDIVNNRNAIVEGLDEDRLREEEEDQQLNEMLEQLGKKGKNKKKSPLSKLFSRRSMKKTENF